MNGDENETTNLIAGFMRSVADNLEKGKIPPEKLETIADFFVTYTSDPPQDRVENDMIKYLTMGWYVYNTINPQQK
jgi:hypothetical protein